MANGDDPVGAGPDDAAGPPGPGGPDPSGAGGDAGGGPPGGPGGGPPGGGPILAALARQRQQPQPSAPGMGNMAHGLMMLKNAVDLVQSALPHLPTGSQQHKDALRAITQLSRHLPQGAPTAGAQQTSLMDLLRNTVRNAMTQRLMAQQGGQGGPAGQPPPPTPATPLPGA